MTIEAQGGMDRLSHPHDICDCGDWRQDHDGRDHFGPCSLCAGSDVPCGSFFLATPAPTCGICGGDHEDTDHCALCGALFDQCSCEELLSEETEAAYDLKSSAYNYRPDHRPAHELSIGALLGRDVRYGRARELPGVRGVAGVH